MKMTKEEYSTYIDARSPKSDTVKNAAIAFAFGGLVCAVGELLSALYHLLGAAEPDAATYATITLVAVAAVLTGVSLYDDIARHVGAGLIVPITGFANSIVSPAMEFKSEGLVLGLAAKMFVVAGPVLVYGIASSVIYGLILLIFR